MSKILLSFLILLSLNAICQSKFNTGYLVTIKGDTLRGNIDFSEYNIKGNKIFLKDNKKDSVFVFDPNNCKGFGIDNQFEFRTKLVTLNLTKVESDKSNWVILPEKSYFLKILESGKISLYQYQYSKEANFYFIETDSSRIDQLIYHTYLRENGSIIFNKYFQNQLYLVSKDKNLKIGDINYDELGIRKFVIRYNNISDSKKIKQVFLKVGAGLAYYEAFEVGTANFKPGISPSISLELVFPLEKKYNTFLFILGLNYSPHTSIKQPASSQYSFANHYSVHTNNMLLSTGIMYMPFRYSKIRPFVGVGIGPNEPFGSSNKLKDGTKFKTTSSKNLYNDEFVFTQHATRIYFKAGLHLSKRLEIETRYDNIPTYNLTYKGSNLKIYNFFVYWRI